MSKPKEWWPALVARWYPGDVFQPTDPGVSRAYHLKHSIVAGLAPESICEIGVRAGYSAFAFLAGAVRAEYLGIDDGLCDRESGEHYLAHAVQLLEEGFNARILRASSHDCDLLPVTAEQQEFEFVHVDGDHSYAGCLADLELAHTSGAKWILVDDYDVGPATVAAACHYFQQARHPEWLGTHYEDGLHGLLLLTRIPA